MPKIVHKNVVAAYLVLVRDGKTLLLRRYNTGYEDGKYSLVAGHVDPEETFTQCIVREAKEEAGIVLDPAALRVGHVMHRNSGMLEDCERVDTFFVCEEWDGGIVNAEPHKCDDLSWYDMYSLPDNTIPYIKQALEGVRDGVFYSEWGW